MTTTGVQAWQITPNDEVVLDRAVCAVAYASGTPETPGGLVTVELVNGRTIECEALFVFDVVVPA